MNEATKLERAEVLGAMPYQRSHAMYAETLKQTPYDAHPTTSAKAKAQGLKLTQHDSEREGGQEATGAATA